MSPSPMSSSTKTGIRVNGINDKIEIPEKNYLVDPEHYAGILDFIAIVQGYRD